ncbi:hypothetical protein [Salibacter halophilus]|uniref:Uncharacterized protein n=1 Tax=Salibacter halophilus TaxID=1803916 RepID=A0A6N6M9X1_9FLAO|nr:hypothetical protein [Salibacter halophilus]KAB1065951.1 hypothetical protein F3059_00325 [Salibacter halophilus]
MMDSFYLEDDYWMQHQSAAHVKLRELLPPEPVEEFVQMGEYLLNFYFPDQQVAIYLIEDSHDHTDSYHLEAKMQADLKAQNKKVIFIEDRDIADDETGVKERLEKEVG